MPIFRSVVAKECGDSKCKRQGLRVGFHEAFCGECGRRLTPVSGWHLRQIALVVGGLLGSTVIGYALISSIAHRPRPLAEDSRKRLEAWVREADRDRSDQTSKSRAHAPLDALVRQERLEPEAAASFVAAVRQRLEEGRRSVARGLRWAAMGRYAEALREYRRAVENDPENAIAWADLGSANAATGHDHEAFEDYAKALQLDPKCWLAHYNLGMLWARRGEPDQAFRHIEQALAAWPDPVSPERRSITRDLRRTPLPDALLRDPRFVTLLDGPKKHPN